MERMILSVLVKKYRHFDTGVKRYRHFDIIDTEYRHFDLAYEIFKAFYYAIRIYARCFLIPKIKRALKNWCKR